MARKCSTSGSIGRTIASGLALPAVLAVLVLPAPHASDTTRAAGRRPFLQIASSEDAPCACRSWRATRAPRPGRDYPRMQWEFYQQFGDAGDCLEWLERLRWVRALAGSSAHPAELLRALSPAGSVREPGLGAAACRVAGGCRRSPAPRFIALDCCAGAPRSCVADNGARPGAECGRLPAPCTDGPRERVDGPAQVRRGHARADARCRAPRHRRG